MKGLFSYDKKTNELAPELFQYRDGDICDLTHDGTAIVYIVNGLQLKECLEDIDRALIYYWSANCTSPSCISLEMAQAFADRSDLELFVVAEYYDAMKRKYALKRPLFGIDTKYHSSNLTKKYSRSFFSDAFGFSSDLEHYSKFVYLEKGEWLASLRMLEDFNKVNITVYIDWWKLLKFIHRKGNDKIVGGEDCLARDYHYLLKSISELIS